MRENSLQQTLQDCIYWNTESNKKVHLQLNNKINVDLVLNAQKTFMQGQIIIKTGMTQSRQLSQIYKANIYLKRQDLQKGKTFKTRGGYYYYLLEKQKIQNNGFVCVSDGNFATSVAMLSSVFKFKFIVFVPECCFKYKLQAMKNYGKDNITIIQEGQDFQSCQKIAKKYANDHGKQFISPHTTEILLPGYATIAKQIIDQQKIGQIDYIIVPSGGGALVTSIASFIKQVSDHIKVIAVQPDICTPYSQSIAKKERVYSEKVSKFCNGSSLKSIGQNCFNIGRSCIDGFVAVTENKVAQTIIKLYSYGYICEPSGALAVAALSRMQHEIVGKKVVCLLTGSNMDLLHLQQARELNAISKNRINYLIIELSNKKKDVYDLLTKCFKKNDVVTIQYVKRFNKNVHKAILAVESGSMDNFEFSLNQMIELKFKVQNITDKSQLLELIL